MMVGAAFAAMSLFAAENRVGEAFNEDRLSQWTVSVNGKASNARLKISNGILYAVPLKGFIITFQ